MYKEIFSPLYCFGIFPSPQNYVSSGVLRSPCPWVHQLCQIRERERKSRHRLFLSPRTRQGPAMDRIGRWLMMKNAEASGAGACLETKSWDVWTIFFSYFRASLGWVDRIETETINHAMKLKICKNTELRKSLCKTYLSRTQAEPGRAVKEQHK